MRLVFKDFPLPSHKLAPLAHEAARCAGALGQYWPYHDRLFAAQPDFERDDAPALRGRARSAARRLRRVPGLAPLRGRRRRPIWPRAAALGVRSTPSFLINGRPVIGAQPVEVFRTAIDEALRETPLMAFVPVARVDAHRGRPRRVRRARRHRRRGVQRGRRSLPRHRRHLPPRGRAAERRLAGGRRGGVPVARLRFRSRHRSLPRESRSLGAGVRRAGHRRPASRSTCRDDTDDPLRRRRGPPVGRAAARRLLEGAVGGGRSQGGAHALHARARRSRGIVTWATSRSTCSRAASPTTPGPAPRATTRGARPAASTPSAATTGALVLAIMTGGTEPLP